MVSQASMAGDWNNGLYFSGALRDSHGLRHDDIPKVTSSVPAMPPVTSHRVTDASPGQQRKRAVRLKGRRKGDLSESYPDIFNDHWLVESPRRIQFEKTTLTAPSRVGAELENFYMEVAQIPAKYITSAKSRTKTLTDYVIPRVVKLGNQIGMKVRGWKYGGSTVDDTQVVLPKEIDIFVLIEKHKAKVEALDAGYKMIPLKRFRHKEGEKPDEYRFGRSQDGTFLSSQTVTQNMYDLIDRSLKLNPQVELQPYVEEQDRPQIVVTFKNKHRFNFIPAIYLETDDTYLTTRPYAHDENPSSAMFWRVSYMEKERQLLALMDKADRGIRRQAFKILKALIRVEHTLNGLTSYHVKTVLLHSFDEAVDNSPRWQRDTLEMSFLSLMRELLHYIRTRQLPHFFIRGYNLFENMSPRKLASLESRIAYLVDHPLELIRVLRKRAS